MKQKDRIIKHYPEIRILSDCAASLTLLEIAHQSTAQRGLFMLAVSGGKTPQSYFKTLAESPYREKLPWHLTSIFWVDERCVPDTRPESNFNNAFNLLLSKVPIPTGNINPILVNNIDPVKAVNLYEQKVRSSFNIKITDGGFPAFDLIILGMGSDGHIASLFPDSSVLKEKSRWFVVVPPPVVSPSIERITMTIPLINTARNVIFLISGEGKKQALDAVLDGNQGSKYPASLIKPEGNLYWFIDDGNI